MIENELALALICSSSPGFFRSIGPALGQQFRLMESYTIQEAAQMMHLHRPSLAVVDLRGTLKQQTSRTWAAVQSAPGTRFVIAACVGQLSDEEIPREVRNRIQLCELSDSEPQYPQFVESILSSQESGTANSGAASVGSAPSGASRTDGSLTQAAVDPDRHAQHPEIRRAVSDTKASAADSGIRGSARAIDADSINSRQNETSTDSSPKPAAALGAPGQRSSDKSHAADEFVIADRFRTRTPELRGMLRRLEVAARHHVTMLLIGETGAGKTHLARLIHDVSPRANEPFLHLACGALPGELIESELFGHVKGAFTSAHADKDGKFLVAGNGTILLDEIDVLTPDQQVKLLRVIEKGEFEPVGSNRTLHVKARIIAASNLQLQPLVEQGRFRPDLYYRLNTLSFSIPPLRKRLPDIEPLARYFVHRHAAQMGIDIVDISPAFMDCLLKYPWPGNVREMENAIRSAVIYSEGGRMTPSTLPQHVVDVVAGPANDPTVTAFHAGRKGESLGNRIGLTEKDIIEQALLNNNFSRTNTARHLGISRVTLYNKMRKYGILPERS